MSYVLGLVWAQWCTELWGLASSTLPLRALKASLGLLGWVVFVFSNLRSSTQPVLVGKWHLENLRGLVSPLLDYLWPDIKNNQSSVFAFRLCFEVKLTICVFSWFVVGPKIKGRDNGPVLITDIALAVFDSAAIWFISFQCTPHPHQ